MNSAQFKTHLVVLADLTNKDLSSGITARYFWETFGNLPDDVLAQAFEIAKRSCKFFPSPSEFEDIIKAVAAQTGAVVNGDTAWEECHRYIFSQYSEANDALIRQRGGYPWPNDRCKVIVREKLNQTVRGIAMLNDYERAKLRERFIKLYDETQAVERAEVAIDAPNVRRLSLEAGD